MTQKMKVVTLKGANAMLLQATLQSLDPAILSADLADAGSLDFEWTPVLVDTSNMPAEAVAAADWAAIKRAFARVRLNVVALNTAAADVAVQHGLGVLDLCGTSTKEAADAETHQELILPPMIVDTPVRTGAQIYAKGRDLIVTGSVSAGAEVIADGNLHVYGRLQGRGIAGASGRTDARIFTLDFQPDLVSIAGVYEQFEAGPPQFAPGKLLVVSLQEGRLTYSSK